MLILMTKILITCKGIIIFKFKQVLLFLDRFTRRKLVKLMSGLVLQICTLAFRIGRMSKYA